MESKTYNRCTRLHRCMVNRKIKEIPSQSDPFVKITADKAVLKFLISEGKKPLGEIRNHMENQGFSYSNRGLILRLNDLIRQKWIVRVPHSGKSQHAYLANKSLNEINLAGFSFSVSASNWLNAIQKSNAASGMEQTIEKLIRRIGFYVLYTHI